MARLPGDEAQRTLEQRALANVHALAHKLGYADALDRNKEKIATWVLGGVALIGVASIGVVILAPDKHVADEQRMRCELAVQLASAEQFKVELRRTYPGMAPLERDERVAAHMKDVKPLAEKECAAKLKAG